MSYHVRIEPRTTKFRLNLREVWDYRDLVVLWTRKTFTIAYKQTVLGPAWLIINPLISSFAYMFLFGFVAGMSTGGVPQILFYLTSTAIWTLFSYCLTYNAATFTNNAQVFGKVYFPRLTVPISNMLVGLLRFGIQISLVVVLLVYFLVQGDVHPNWWAMPLALLALLQICILGTSVGLVLSSATTKYRDLQILVSFGVQILMYVTPIVYPLSQVAGTKLEVFMLVNPVTAPVEAIRYALLGSGSLDPLYLVVSLVMTVALTLAGIVLFNHVEQTFIDTV